MYVFRLAASSTSTAQSILNTRMVGKSILSPVPNSALFKRALSRCRRLTSHHIAPSQQPKHQDNCLSYFAVGIFCLEGCGYMYIDRLTEAAATHAGRRGVVR